MRIVKNNFFSFVFILLCCSQQTFWAEISFTKIKYLHAIINKEFISLSPLIGFSWWLTQTIENLYRYGNKNDATIQLIRELFHLQYDEITFDVTVLGNKPAKYFNAKFVGSIIGLLKLHEGKTHREEDKTQKLKADLSDLFSKHFDIKKIVEEPQKRVQILESEKILLETEIKNAKEIRNNQQYQTLTQAIRKKNKEIIRLNKGLNKYKILSQEKHLSPEESDEIKTLLKNMTKEDLNILLSMKFFDEKQINEIKKIQGDMKTLQDQLKTLQEKQRILEQSILEKTEKVKKELRIIEARLYKQQVSEDVLQKEIDKLISLIAKSCQESLQGNYIPHITTIILLSFLWRKADEKSDFKDYFDAVSTTANISLVAQYPPDWDKAEYTFDEYDKLKKDIETVVSQNKLETYLKNSKDYEELIFAFAAYKFWDQPFPQLITATNSDYVHNNLSYKFGNCVEVSILYFIMMMLANSNKTAISMEFLDALAENKNTKIEPVINDTTALYNFLHMHKNLAYMQTSNNQNNWNNVVQNLKGVVYNIPETADESDKFCEIRAGLRNILKVFNHLFFNNSPQFDAFSIAEQISEICLLFKREGLKITWDCDQDVNMVDVSEYGNKKIILTQKLTLNFEVEKNAKPITFSWELQVGHSVIRPSLKDKPWDIENSTASYVLNHLDAASVMGILPWVAQVINNYGELPDHYKIIIMYMRQLQKNEEKIALIKAVINLAKDQKNVPFITDLISYLPDDKLYNDILYIIAHTNKVELLYPIIHKRTLSAQEGLFLKAVADNYNSFAQKELKENPDLVNSITVDENTPLHIASFYGNAEIIPLLLSYQADINAQNSDRRTPLSIAVEVGMKNIVRLLLEAGADPTIEDSEYNAPLQYATANGDQEMINLLSQ